MPPTDPSWSGIHEKCSRKGLTDPDAPVQASGEIAIECPPKRVWAVLTDVSRWSEIRSDIGDASIEGSVASDSLFTWSIAEIILTSKFGLLVPYRELSWSTTTTGLVMTVRYLFEPLGASGTLLNCHEALTAPMYPQLGGNTELGKRIESWLEGVKAVAEQSDPACS